jgi:hypothetical protein
MKQSTLNWKRVAYPDYVFDCIRNRCWVNQNKVWVRVDGVESSVSTAGFELADATVRILGENGLARFREFRSYGNGWDFGEGEALSPTSIQRMERFLEAYSDFHRRPSLFLTRRGNLMLGWEDEADNPIELEFESEGYLLCRASTDEERVYPDQAFEELLDELTKISTNGSS